MPLATLAALAICFFSYRYWRSVVPDAPMLPVLGRAIMLFAALPATSIGGNPLGPRFSGLVFGIALGLMIATHARLQRALPARVKRAPGHRMCVRPRCPNCRAESSPAWAAPISRRPSACRARQTAAPGSSRFGALVSRTSSTPRSNRPNFAR